MEKNEEILEFISGLSVLELSELIKEFEYKFGVKAKQIENKKEKQQKRNSISLKKGSFQKRFFRGF